MKLKNPGVKTSKWANMKNVLEILQSLELVSSVRKMLSNITEKIFNFFHYLK